MRFLRKSLAQADLSCAALRELRDELNRLADSDAGRKAEEAFGLIPNELYAVNSLTLAVNPEALRQTELSDALADELRFAAAFAALVEELAACGMEGSGKGDLFGQVCMMGEAAVKAVLRNRMGYEAEPRSPG